VADSQSQNPHPRRIFSHLRAITVYVVFPWQQLIATLAFDEPLARSLIGQKDKCWPGLVLFGLLAHI
jgi:hypothetical protein